jgi:hypothetical protein
VVVVTVAVVAVDDVVASHACHTGQHCGDFDGRRGQLLIAPKLRQKYINKPKTFNVDWF